MSVRECPQEQALVGDFATSGCRARLGEALLHHLDGCSSCRELASLMESIQADHARAQVEHQLPTASQVWWRARVRAKLDAAHTVDRPIRVAHSVTAAALLGLAASLVGMQSIVDGMTVVRDVASHIVIDDVAGALAAAVQTGPIRFTMLAVVGCLAIVVPVAALVALSRD